MERKIHSTFLFYSVKGKAKEGCGKMFGKGRWTASSLELEAMSFMGNNTEITIITETLALIIQTNSHLVSFVYSDYTWIS